MQVKLELDHFSAVAKLMLLMAVSTAVLATESEPRQYDVLFTTSWEHGVDDRLQYQMPERDSIEDVDFGILGTPRALKVTIFRDQNYQGVANGTPRAEISFGEFIKFHRNGDYLVNWQTYIPADYVLDKEQPEVITQIHQGAQIKTGYPTFALFLSADGGYGVRSHTQNSNDSIGKIFGNPADDRGRVVNWSLHYIPDDTGKCALTELFKDGQRVFQSKGTPNAYANDDNAYLKFGIYKAGWQVKPSDVRARTMYFGRLSIFLKR